MLLFVHLKYFCHWIAYFRFIFHLYRQW